MHIQAKRRTSVGITLIELLVALALVGVVLSAAGTMLLQSYANEAAYRGQNTAQQNARTATDTITDDLRGVVKDSLPLSPTTHVQGTPLTFNFYNDAGAQQTVSYYRHTTENNLYRRLGTASPVVIAQNITAFTVTPRDANGAVLTSNPQNVRRADVAITATVGNAPNPVSAVTVNARATLRNYLLR